jgi:hypothetical protein
MSSLKKCFINYRDKWFLKEKCNCALNQDEKVLYELILKQKEHPQVFKNIYSEENVISFLCELNRFLSNLSTGGIDKTEKNAKYCFNFDRLMSWLELFNLCQVASDTEGIEKFAKLIIDRAINYGIITPSDEKDFSSDEGIQ